MTNITPFPQNEDRRLAEASDWIAALERGLSEEEEQKLGEWLARDTDNFDQFMELAALWDQMDVLQELSTLFPESKQKRRFNVRAAALAVAASLVAVLSLQWILPWGNDPANPDAATISDFGTVIFETVIGEQASHELADGSRLLLNTSSRVQVEFTATNRLLRLERGEIHVKVTHDPARPLSVMVDNTVIQAVGTEFNVEVTQDQKIELVVTEGLVMVGIMSAPSGDLPGNMPVLLRQDSRLVGSGEKAVIAAGAQSTDRIDPERIESSDIAVELSWREGNLIFRGESLEEAIHEVGRYTAVEFVILDEEAKKVRVAGMFKAGDVEGLLAALRNHFDITYQRDGEERILLSAD